MHAAPTAPPTADGCMGLPEERLKPLGLLVARQRRLPCCGALRCLPLHPGARVVLQSQSIAKTP